MTHSLHELADENGDTVYQLIRKIKLTAKSGPIASFVRETCGVEPGGRPGPTAGPTPSLFSKKRRISSSRASPNCRRR